MLYVDHAATTPLRPEAADAMVPFGTKIFGNPSGVHAVARAAKNAVEDARERAASMIGADHPLEVVFTGGGTESDNLAVKGAAFAGDGGVVTTAVEHEAVLEAASFLRRIGKPVTVVGVGRDGAADPDEIASAVGGSTAVVSVMAANNETGIRQPVAKVGHLVREARPGTVLHCDAVQAFVSEQVSVDDLGVDLMSLAAHKFGGPKGVGLLYVRRGVDLEPVLHGGGQEMGRRSGTHNVAAIVGMVAAMEAASADRARLRGDVREARRRFEASLVAEIPAVRITERRAERLLQHSHFRIPGVAAETLLIRLDGAGVAAAAGSACHSGAVTPSHVLTAMGWSELEAAEAIRVSFGWTTRPQDGETVAAAVAAAAEDLL